MTRFICILALLCLLPFPVLADAAQDRVKIRDMRIKTLTRLYREEPESRRAIESAAGYAVFSSGGVNVIFFSAAYGSGLAYNNKTGKETFMEMASGGIGIGLGVKDYRLVFVFRTRDAFRQFVDSGWDFSGQADAAAKASIDGGEFSGAIDVMPGVKVYQLTEAGLALQATLQGTKYWTDDDLNYY